MDSVWHLYRLFLIIASHLSRVCWKAPLRTSERCSFVCNTLTGAQNGQRIYACVSVHMRRPYVAWGQPCQAAALSLCHTVSRLSTLEPNLCDDAAYTGTSKRMRRNIVQIRGPILIPRHFPDLRIVSIFNGLFLPGRARVPDYLFI